MCERILRFICPFGKPLNPRRPKKGGPPSSHGVRVASETEAETKTQSARSEGSVAIPALEYTKPARAVWVTAHVKRAHPSVKTAMR